MNDWIYSMRDVLSLMQQDGYFPERIPGGGEYRCSCPICGRGKKINKSFCVDLNSEIYHCFSCSTKGKYSTNLYAEVNNIDRAAANNEILSRLGIDTKTAYPKRERRIDAPVASIDAEAEVASIMTRDKVYRTVLRQLSLSEKHKEDLLNRGLTEREISELGYKTFPGNDTKTVWKIVDALEKENLNPEGCAGFYKTKNKNVWFCKYPAKDVVMVKYMTFDNKLSGFQMRRNNEDLLDGDGKYMWWSTKGENHGAKPAGMIHYACDFEKNEKGEWQPKVFEGKSGKKYMTITEGAMKGDIAHMISGKPFICIPGVSIIKDLEKDLPKLKELGVTTFILAYDIDQLMNINVLKHLKALAETLVSYGFEVINGTVWDIEYTTVSGNKQKFDLDYDFVFTSETLKDAIEFERLESILEDLISYGRINVFFAVSGSFTQEDKVNYKKLLSAAKKAKFQSCKYVKYKCKYKGIDDFNAGTQRNVEYI